MMQPRLKHFGWGREGEGLTSAEETFVFERIEQRFGPLADGEVKPPRLEDLKIETPRLNPPASLPFCSTALYDRAAHTYGKSFPDYVRGLVGDYSNAPDVVAYPRTEEEIVAVLDWAGGAQASVTPFGGGSSVVGGVEPRRDAARHKAAVTIDLRELGRVLEIDKTSRAARIEAGAFGPALEAQLKPHGLTLRHFPQSFECSTLGGWIATRSGGHFATLYTHIDDLVESLRVITPKGLIETRRLPGSGAGPSPDRLLIGSEGILGIITQAWMRLQDRPKFRAGGAVQFPDFFTAARALRVISQAGLYPANCRILDAEEAFNTGAADGSVAIMVLAFEFRRPSSRAMDEARTRMLPRSRRQTRTYLFIRHSPRRRGRRLAQCLYSHALCARAHHSTGHHQRYVRDGDHLGAVRVIPRQSKSRDRARHRRGNRTGWPGNLPLHPCLSGRASAILHLPRRRAAWRVERAVARHQVGRS